MLKAHIGRFAHDAVSGWVLDTKQPRSAVLVSIYVDGRQVADRLAGDPRGDLARLPGFGDGRHGFRHEFATPLAPDRAHFLTLYCARTGEMLPGADHMLVAAKPAPAPPPGGLTPILVTGTGRTGTTLLMSLLAHSPDIVAADLMPYETRYLTYYAAARDVLSHPANIVRSTHQDRIRGDGHHIGFNPFHCAAQDSAFQNRASVRDFSIRHAPASLDAAFSAIVTEYYRRLSRDQNKPDVRYFAEKNDNLSQPVRVFARRAFGQVREIVTLRDPRDTLCSAMVYFKGIELERAFRDISHACKVLLAIDAEASPDVFLCHYRALLQNDPVFLDALSAFLGTRMIPRPADIRASMFDRHATSPSSAATLDRWRTDLAPDLLARCNAAWAPFLDRFGFSRDGDRSAPPAFGGRAEEP